MPAEKQAEGIRKFAADVVKLDKFDGSSAARSALKCRQSRVDVTPPPRSGRSTSSGSPLQLCCSKRMRHPKSHAPTLN